MRISKAEAQLILARRKRAGSDYVKDLTKLVKDVTNFVRDNSEERKIKEMSPNLAEYLDEFFDAAAKLYRAI